MKNRVGRFHMAVCSVALSLVFAIPASAAGPPQTKVNGTLTEIDGIPVLRVWGTPQERGFAYGYLVGQDIVRLVNGFLASGTILDVEGYNNRILPRLNLMKVPPEYEAELRGMLAGIEARAGGPVDVPAIGRPLQYDDLVAANSMGDMLRSGCSSFAAWGRMTKNGHTLAGRNMDWPTNPALEGSQIVVVYVPPPDSKALGWVSVFWPGLIGCTTGMNAEGVTVAMHDSNSSNPSTSGSFTSSTLLYRKAVESAHAETVVEDISRVFKEYYTLAGYNMMVTRPSAGRGAGAVVFEHDGDLVKGRGMTLRKPEGSGPFLACTNHSRKRYDPRPGIRYPKLSNGLEQIAEGEKRQHLTVKRAWNMLEGVPIEGILTHHSVVFEPNKGLMHVAFAENGKHAPQCKKVVLDVGRLLAGDYPGGR
ncbi:MAG: hypothetical protein JSU86_12005 [Phycisphaerales bacterium]|nr:MAG: hypothetical protein JSU86_12005 [Phycisphaerales bacterium]